MTNRLLKISEEVWFVWFCTIFLPAATISNVCDKGIIVSAVLNIIISSGSEPAQKFYAQSSIMAGHYHTISFLSLRRVNSCLFKTLETYFIQRISILMIRTWTPSFLLINDTQEMACCPTQYLVRYRDGSHLDGIFI